MAGLGPYPQPYTMQDEQRAEPRREKRAPPDRRGAPDRRGELIYLLAVAIVILVAVAITLFFGLRHA
ncbi:MAG: hypothetical protein AB7S97_01100 [Thermoplasmata archaeon]